AGSVAKRPGVGRMLLRGLVRRCPWCGSGRVFSGWSTMVERCPRCHVQLDRGAEEGFFLGAMTINIVVTEGSLALVLFGYVLALAGGGHTSIVPAIVAGCVAAVIVPILFYPSSKTLWSAFDLALRP